jgi:putative hemolysin
MKVPYLILFICLGILLILSGCTQTVNNGSGTPAVTTTTASLANPAAVFCKEKNYGYEIRKNPDGSEYGVCIFPDGRECEEWAYFRGTCNETTLG